MTRVTNDDKKPSLDEALQHYGVKGMKWGVRRTASELNKARKTIDKEIVDARSAKPQMEADVKAAKKQYKADKKAVGRKGAKEAKKALKEARVKKMNNADIASRKTSNEALEKLVMDSIWKEANRPGRRDLATDATMAYIMTQAIRDL